MFIMIPHAGDSARAGVAKSGQRRRTEATQAENLALTIPDTNLFEAVNDIDNSLLSPKKTKSRINVEAVIRRDSNPSTPEDQLSKQVQTAQSERETVEPEDFIDTFERNELSEIKESLRAITELLQSQKSNETPIDANLSIEESLVQFESFSKIDLGQGVLTTKGHMEHLKRFFRQIGKKPAEVTAEDVRAFLTSLDKYGADHKKNYLCALRRYYRDFLKHGSVIESFKLPRGSLKPIVVPTKSELKTFYNALGDNQGRALFLFYGATGFRRNEALTVRREDINLDTGMIIPKDAHAGSTKFSWVSFLNFEARDALKIHLDEKNPSPKERIFPLSKRQYQRMFQETSKRCGVRITAQVLREWNSCELGNRGVQDRYIDAFHGRTPKSVLSRNYTDYTPEKLLKIYQKADLRILTE